MNKLRRRPNQSAQSVPSIGGSSPQFAYGSWHQYTRKCLGVVTSGRKRSLVLTGATPVTTPITAHRNTVWVQRSRQCSGDSPPPTLGFPRWTTKNWTPHFVQAGRPRWGLWGVRRCSRPKRRTRHCATPRRELPASLAGWLPEVNWTLCVHTRSAASSSADCPWSGDALAIHDPRHHPRRDRFRREGVVIVVSMHEVYINTPPTPHYCS